MRDAGGQRAEARQLVGLDQLVLQLMLASHVAQHQTQTRAVRAGRKPEDPVTVNAVRDAEFARRAVAWDRGQGITARRSGRRLPPARGLPRDREVQLLLNLPADDRIDR